jgi:hypothetical protein
VGFEEETHYEKHTHAMNNEAPKLQVTHTIVQHHNTQFKELDDVEREIS